MPEEDLSDLLRGWPGEHVVMRHDAASGAWMFIAIHSSRLGPPTGGTRMKPYASPAAALRDAMRLAEGMTYKWAVLGVGRGGGKAVIDVPEGFGGAGRDAMLRRYAEMLERLAGGFETGPDMGTGPAEMDLISEVSGHVFGKSASRGGAGDPGPWTARGVFAGIRASCRHLFGTGDIKGRSILVQGAGHVGAPLTHMLCAAGARVIVCDNDPARIVALRAPGARAVPPEGALDEEVDVFAPCAGGAVLNEKSIPRLRCRIVAGSANNQL